VNKREVVVVVVGILIAVSILFGGRNDYNPCGPGMEEVDNGYGTVRCVYLP
jgi:hypothetical protein